jgi:hypothetical protein
MWRSGSNKSGCIAITIDVQKGHNCLYRSHSIFINYYTQLLLLIAGNR